MKLGISLSCAALARAAERLEGARDVAPGRVGAARRRVARRRRARRERRVEERREALARAAAPRGHVGAAQAPDAVAAAGAVRRREAHGDAAPRGRPRRRRAAPRRDGVRRRGAEAPRVAAAPGPRERRGVDAGGVEARGGVEPRERGAEVRVEELVGDDAAPPARNSNLQADFNLSLIHI